MYVAMATADRPDIFSMEMRLRRLQQRLSANVAQLIPPNLTGWLSVSDILTQSPTHPTPKAVTTTTKCQYAQRALHRHPISQVCHLMARTFSTSLTLFFGLGFKATSPMPSSSAMGSTGTLLLGSLPCTPYSPVPTCLMST